MVTKIPTKHKKLREHTDRVKNEYETHLMKHDPNTPEAAHWRGKEKAWLRFKILTQIDDLNGMRVLDFGCGNAMLVDFLKEQNIDCEYHGWDISEKMIEVAKKKNPEFEFKIVDVIEEDTTNYNGYFDYILISGVFYIKVDAKPEVHDAWIKATLKKLWPLCKKGISFNAITEYVDWKDETLYYCSIGDTISFCVNNLSRWISLKHDFPLWEFTMYVYKDSRWKL